MGVIVTARNINPQNQSGLLKPIIYYSLYKGVAEKAVSINLDLAQAPLMGYGFDSKSFK